MESTLNIDAILERCPSIRDDIRSARADWTSASDDAKAEVRAARAAIGTGRSILGQDAVRIASVESGELLTGDETVERIITERLTEITEELRGEYDDDKWRMIHGVGATFGNLYEFRDRWGPYLEVMSRYAFSESLDLPDLQTSLCRGHQGEGMATTRGGRYRLAVDDYGLLFAAAVDPLEADAGELLRKLENKSTIGDTSVGAGPKGYAGEWDDEYMMFTILRWSLSRGEISIVRTGANPGGWADIVREKPADEDKSAPDDFDLDREWLALELSDASAG